LWHLCCSEVSISPLFRWPNSVNHFKEWMWLESAGIEMFQGDLFSKAKLNGIPSVAWPEKK
ncbi:hypothetical protein RNQ23_23595, partial [Escherichia coli]|nr:hypothetical protein [Escherichia coli]